MWKFLTALTFIGILASPLAAQDLQVADSLLFDAKYEQLIRWVDQQLTGKVSSDMSLSLQIRKVEAFIRLGRFQDAERLLNTISPGADSYFESALVQLANGSLLLNQGMYDQSMSELQSALSNLEKDKKETSAEAAAALAYLGNLYRATGKYVQAEEQLVRSLAIRQQLFGETSEWIAASYNDLGLVFSQSDNDKALEYYEKALTIYEKLHGRQHPKTAIATTNIGFVYSRLELFGDAINNYEEALKIWEKIYPQPHPAKAFLLYNLGDIYWKLDNTKAASGYYERALGDYEQSYGALHPDIATVRNAMGNLSLAAGRYDEAIDWYQKALHANVQGFNSTDIDNNPNIRNYYNGAILVNTLLYKAQALEARYYGKTIRMSDLRLAVKTIQACDILIDNLRQHITNESDKISLGIIAADVYGTGVRLAYGTGEVAANKHKWNALAYYFAEKSKSAVLLEAIADVNAKSFAGIPDPLLEEERKLKASLALTAQLLAQKPDEKEERLLRDKSFELTKAYDAFSRALEKNYPQYFNLKYNSTSPSVTDLQKKLDSHTAVLSYFTDDKQNQLYIFLVTQNRFRIISRPLSKDLDRYVTGLRNGLFFNTPEVYTRASETLSRELIPGGIPGGVTDLVVIPTGRLSIIPFETLFSGKRKNGAEPPFLLGKYNIRYEFSTSLILQKESRKPNMQRSILLCAPVIFDEDEQLQDLPGTESEVREIARLFTSMNYKNESFVKGDASEKLAKSGKLKEFDYLHFATHGIVDERSPELSRIFLSPSPASEDGELYTGEIYNLEIDADLVTLSACQTGLGKISKGEGVIGLSRALVYAGARNIMVSFWSVSDESTSLLMNHFYRFMLNDPGKDFGNSLRKAKLELMKTDKYKSPYFWAPFVLIGF